MIYKSLHDRSWLGLQGGQRQHQVVSSLTLGLQKCVHKLIAHLEMSMDVSSQGETANFVIPAHNIQ